MMTAYGERQGMPFAVAGLSRTLIRLVIIAVGLMTLLKNFGIDITPLLTALGGGGLAVALALQDTLANFFAGVHLLVERPISVGDLILLENGQEGVVSDIGWRTTRVRTGGNDFVVAPNVKITSGILVNYSQPENRAVAEIPVLVAHNADPEQVRHIALEEAGSTEGVLNDPAPVCLFDPGVLLTHLQFKLLVNVASRVEQGRVTSEIRMRLLRRFRAEGVPLPSPELIHADRR
jgi:small-conductance mechanosensitive channel